MITAENSANSRNVAMQYLELTQREAEYVALSRDTTEADLKQRREIRGNAADYFDQVFICRPTAISKRRLPS